MTIRKSVKKQGARSQPAFLCLGAAIFLLLITLEGKSCAPQTTGNNKIVCLTFDDGPNPGPLKKILDCLDEKKVPAAFFVMGFKAREYPEIIRSMAQKGYEIENHTYGHGRLDKLTIAKAVRDVERASELLLELTGRRPVYLRPPHMTMTPDLRVALQGKGYRILGWDIGSKDWLYLHDKDKVIQEVQSQLGKRQGGVVVILFHETTWTAEALPEIVDWIRAHGWQFGLLSTYIPTEGG